MYRILDAELLAPDIKRFVVEAPRVAAARRPGQFVIVRVTNDGERIPLTIADADGDAVVLIVQGVGATTRHMNLLEAGDALADVAGPLGMPGEMRRFGTVVVVAGGVGAAIAYPTAVALAEAGNEVVTVIGARTAAQLILRQELEAVSARTYICTDDGSEGRHGQVTDVLAGLLDPPPHRVIAVGPVPMMAAVADLTRPPAIPTLVSLNPIMVDGTGMCGGCRVVVGGTTRFACVDGPEFDAHLVDFALLARRNTAYRGFEREHLAGFEASRPTPLAR